MDPDNILQVTKQKIHLTNVPLAKDTSVDKALWYQRAPWKLLKYALLYDDRV